MKKLEDTLAGRTLYETHFPDGSIRELTWEELHGPQGLKFTKPALHAVLRYRPIYPSATPLGETDGRRGRNGSNHKHPPGPRKCPKCGV